jgi:hypothetical protein
MGNQTGCFDKNKLRTVVRVVGVVGTSRSVRSDVAMDYDFAVW